MDNLDRKTVKVVELQDRLAEVNTAKESEENTMEKLQNTTAEMEERTLRVLASAANMEMKNEEAKKLPKLPEIKPSDRTAVLCRNDNGDTLNIMGVVDKTTKLMKAYNIFVADGNGEVYIGEGRRGIKLSKARLRKADNSSVLEGVNQFQVNFSQDNLKTAYVRAKKFMEVCQYAVSDENSKTVGQAYREIVQYAMDYVKIKGQEKTSDIKYDPETKIVSIRDKQMQNVLDIVAPNYKRTAFCSDLAFIENYMDEKIIVRNRSGNKGYGYNETGNRMYYKFRVVDKLMNIGA